MAEVDVVQEDEPILWEEMKADSSTEEYQHVDPKIIGKASASHEGGPSAHEEPAPASEAEFHEEEVRVPKLVPSKPRPHEPKRAGKKQSEGDSLRLRQPDDLSEADDMEAIEQKVEQLGSQRGTESQQRPGVGGTINSSQQGYSTNLRHGYTRRRSQAGLSSWLGGGSWAFDSDDEDDDEKDEQQPCCPWLSDICGDKKARAGPCYYMFVLVFLGFLLVFPLFFVWLVTSPMPSMYWNELYDPFPVLLNKTFITERTGWGYNVTISEIPTSPDGCNYSCIGTTERPDTAETSFAMTMTLDAPKFPHTAFPVVLASNDFHSWWVAADKTDATGVTFFPSNGRKTSDIYRLTTDECTRPPTEVTGLFQDPRELLTLEDNWASGPIYALVCVSWSWDSIVWHTNHSEMTAAEIGQHCQAIGGVCGWPCGAYPEGTEKLMGCEKGMIQVDTEAGTIAEVEIPGANFSGHVGVRACITHPGAAECVTTAAPMPEWPCHKCRIESIMREIYPDPEFPDEAFNKTYVLRYDSLPTMEVTLSDVELNIGDVIPRAYFITTKNQKYNQGPQGLNPGGTWRKLYSEHSAILSDPHFNPKRESVDQYQQRKEIPWLNRNVPERIDEDDLFDVPMELDTSRYKMEFIDQTKVKLNPPACFASRGPLYLVACAVNMSTYDSLFAFQKGQPAAPPPFNDRCLAVYGRCGYACSSQTDGNAPLQYCNEDGEIDFEELFKEFEVPVNDAGIVHFFMWSLFFGFTVKLMTYCPGLFSPDTHPQFYNKDQTGKFKYISVVTPSGGETKACCIRNLVGAISCLPAKCQCPFHVVFADEGHRHPHKMAFRSLVAVVNAVPESNMLRKVNPDGARRIRVKGKGYKEENLKSFMKYWTEMSRQVTLADCETAKMAQKIKDLTERGEGKAEVEVMNNKIDRLCGLEALRRCQVRAGWKKASEDPEIKALESAIMKLRQELTCGEKDYVDKADEEKHMPVPPHLDDCLALSWPPAPEEEAEAQAETSDAKEARDSTTGQARTSSPPDETTADRTTVQAADGDDGKRLYTLHYVARSKPDEDERTLKVQHVARGIWYYRIPRDQDICEQRSWRQWRMRAQVYQDGESSHHWFVVPLRTSRGKAGGLNYVENYLFDYGKRFEEESVDPPLTLPSLYSIADARHQFQPDFFHETIPFFFKQNNKEVDPRVAFTQSPQYFPEMPDDVDYLDTNNANFFRLNCMLRNCCGGVSSCGTNGTWLVRDRRAGKSGLDTIWEPEERFRMDFIEKIEHRFFHESCKVEDTASSLDRVVRGKYSQYVNRRLSYGMAKDPVDYLAAVQRWAEGGVVLSLQTFFGCGEGIHMIWMSMMLFIAFIASLANLVFGWGYQGILKFVSEQALGDEILFDYFEEAAGQMADWFLDWDIGEAWHREVYVDMFLEVEIWFVVLCIAVFLLWVVTFISYYMHVCPCCPGRKRIRRTRFPTSMAQWARLAITLDNLTYFLWFWTSFFWVGFNYYGVFARRYYHFEAAGMVLFSYLVQVLGWSLVITASSRYRTEQGASSNEVFFLSLTNVWRTTQLFYITAPLVLYSIIMGTSDMLRNRMLGVDISYWVGGDRGAVSKSIAQVWTLLLIIGAVVAHFFYWSNRLPHANIGGLLIVTFIALDVMHPCAFLWLGVAKEKLPNPPRADRPNWQRWILRLLQLLFSLAFYRNIVRSLVFAPRTTHVVKWIGPVQNVVFPTLTFFLPDLGVNQALLLLASTRT